MSPGRSEFSLGDYVEVKDRIRMFYEQYPHGRIVTTRIEKMTLNGEDYVVVQAQAWTGEEDYAPTVGSSWMKVPGSTTYTKGSELENTETSAWGRAIGALGIGIDKSVASANEVRAKRVDPDVERRDDGSLIGKVEVGTLKTRSVFSDFLLRHDSERGPVIGFRLRGDRGGILVRAFGPLATQLDEARELIIGQTVTVWPASIDDETLPATSNKPKTTFQLCTAERVSIPGIGILPVTPPEFPDFGVAEGQEAFAFDAEDQRKIDEALAGIEA